jgi:hypothetical protein
MATTLKEYLKANPPGEFRAVPHYFPSGDYLTYFVSDERCHAKRLDDVVTVYLANESGRLVGCKVKGVRHILNTAGAFGVDVDGGDGIRLGFFFFAGAAPDRKDREPVKKWYELLKELADVTVDPKVIALAS